MKKQGERTDLKPVANFATSSIKGPAATAKKIGSIFGSSERKVRYAYEFARAVDKVKEINPRAAKKILEGKVKDAPLSIFWTVSMSPCLKTVRALSTVLVPTPA